MALEQRNEYKSEWESLHTIAPKIGCKPDTLRTWIRQYERNKALSDNSLAMNESQRIKELERENRELRRSNDILRKASAYFAQAQLDRQWKK